MDLFSKLFKGFREEKKGKIAKAWEFVADDTITTPPAANKEGSLIVFGTKSGKIYALNQDGKKIWDYTSKKELGKEQLFFLDEEKFKQISAKPVIADMENRDDIIIGSEVGNIFMLNSNGRLKWNFLAQDAIKASALVADINNDGNKEIVFGSNDGYIYTLNAKGKLVWKIKLKSGIEASPAFLKSKRNQIIVGSNDGTIYSLDKNGNLLWEFKTNGKITAQPATAEINNQMVIIIGSQDNNLYALDENGGLMWNYPTKGKIFSKAVIADINHDMKPEILVGSCDDKLHVISGRGTRIWDYETGFWVVAPPLAMDIDNNRMLEIVIGSYDGSIYVLDGTSNFALDYVPGISSITQQSGHYFDVIQKEPGNYYGKLLHKFSVQAQIIGAEILENEKGILIATNTKKLDKLIYI